MTSNINKLYCLIATNNQFKIDSLKKILEDNKINFEISSHSAESGVRDAPYDDETPQGAYNRVQNLLNKNINADVYIGLETGIVRRWNKVYIETWCVLKYLDNWFTGYSSGIEIPEKNHSDIWDKSNKELCDWVDARADKQDLVSYFTNKKMDRSNTFEEALRNAFISAKLI